MKQKMVRAAPRYAAVAALFAVCGAGTAIFVWRYGDIAASGITYLITFPLLCAVLFMRTRKASFICPLMAIAGAVAVCVATILVLAVLGLHSSSFVIPACVGGSAGGFGVALCCTIEYRCLFSRSYLLGATLVGGLAAVPFSAVIVPFGRPDPRVVALAFAFWQAAMGTYLYAICTGAKEKALPDHSQDLTSDSVG